jgi:lysophospholipase L1-like esterase
VTAKLDTDTDPRVQLTSDGEAQFGSGTDTPDVTLKRVGPGVLGTNGALVQAGNAVLDSSRLGVAGGLAVLGEDGKVPADQLPEMSAGGGNGTTNPNAAFQSLNGYYVPPEWGRFWRTKRDAAKAGTGRAVVAAVGSSATAGLYCSNLITTSFVGRILTNLQSTYGDGGSGFFSSTRSLTYMGASTTANAWNGLAGNLAATTGNWVAGNAYGPGSGYLYASTPGNTMGFTVRGTQIRVYTVAGFGRSAWTYSVDGAAAVTVNDAGTSGTVIQVTTIDGLTAGSHTITLTHAGASGAAFSVAGVTGENANGVVVNNFGLSGSSSGRYTDFSADSGAGRWSGGPDYPADLVIYAAGANDANSGMSADSWAANLRQFLSGVRDSSTVGGVPVSGSTDVLILMQHIGRFDTANLKWQDYVARAQPIAEAYGAALVNLWTLGRNSWNYWSNLGYWGTSLNPGGVSGPDTIHMSDAGHQATADAVLPVLTS